MAELLIERLDVRSTERVLDVATGSGNAAIAAARRGCEVVGVDYVPALLERARRRSKAEGLSIDYVEGDAEALTFLDGSFDVVTSVFGAMFAPDQDQTASELLRVTRSGGRIGIVAHTPEGFIGQLFRTIAKHVPPPAGLRSPIQWGTEVRLRGAVRRRGELHRSEKRTYAFRARSPEAWVETGAASTARSGRRSTPSAGSAGGSRWSTTSSSSSGGSTGPPMERWSSRRSIWRR